MGSSWKNTDNELSNYYLQDNTSCDNSPNVGNAWLGPEGLAWICNQNDNCLGFTFNKGSGHGGWLVTGNWNCPTLGSTNGVKGIMGNARTDRATYVKQSKTWRKADQPDTSDPSILDRSVMTTRFKGWGTSFAPDGDYKLSTGQTCCWNPQWGSGYTNGYPTCNQMDSYKVPLGWKWMITNNGIDRGDSVEAYWDRNNMGWDGNTYALDNPTFHGMTNNDDCVLAQNIGFDVDLHWLDMVNKGVEPADEILIKKNWCNSRSTSQLISNKARCKGTSTSGAVIMTDTEYNTRLVNAALADTNNDWAGQPDVINELKGLVQSTSTGDGDSKSHILGLFQTFCGGDPINTKATGPNRTNPLCACINAANFGFQGTSNCFDAPMKAYPGCASYSIGGSRYLGIVDRISPLLSLPKNVTTQATNSLGNAPGCVTQACTLATGLGNDHTLPYTGASCPALNVQVCGIDINVGAAQDSPINARCDQTQTTNINMGTSPPPGPASPPGHASPPGPASPPVSTSSKTPLFIGGGVFICFCFLMIVILIVMSGGENKPNSSSFEKIFAAQLRGAGA